MTKMSRRAVLAALLAGGCLSIAWSNTSAEIPASILTAFGPDLSPDNALRQLMPAIVSTMETDRCFVYMRDPVERRTAFTHGHSALPDWRSFDGGAWSQEPNLETLNEPMLKKAFTDPTALFIDDIETAAPGVLNVSLERSFFGHRALVHAPIYHGGAFYGILETAVRDKPRAWTPTDRALIEWLQPRVAELAARYLGHA